MSQRVIIGCNFEQFKSVGGDFEPNRFLLLDNIEDRDVQMESTLATQPLQSGDTVADHMYRNPIKYTIKGKFSLNGMNWNDISYDFIGEGDRLTNIQKAFERIKDEAILCTIMTIDSEALPGYSTAANRENISLDYDAQNDKLVNVSSRFKIRKNMALQSITWAEQQNTLAFTFNFTQIIMVETQEYVNLDEALRKELCLPLVTNPTGSSLGSVLSDTGALSVAILQTLYANGYIENDFLEACKEIGQGIAALAIASVIVAFAAAVIVGTVSSLIAGGVAAAAIGGAAAAIFPVGTIIVAAVAIVGAVVGFFAWVFSNAERERKRRLTFKLINGSAEQDLYRLIDLLDDIETEVNKINYNVSVYTIQEDVPHQTMINIAGNYYVINFKENNLNGYGWEASVTDVEGNPLPNMRHENWTPVAKIGDMDQYTNMWFKDNTKQFHVYLMNPALDEAYNPTEAEQKAVRDKLSSYTIWVSKGDIKPHVQAIYDAVEKAIQKRGFN